MCKPQLVVEKLAPPENERLSIIRRMTDGPPYVVSSKTLQTRDCLKASPRGEVATVRLTERGIFALSVPCRLRHLTASPKGRAFNTCQVLVETRYYEEDKNFPVETGILDGSFFARVKKGVGETSCKKFPPHKTVFYYNTLLKNSFVLGF